MDIQASFTRLVNAMAPPWPDALGGAKVKAKISAVLAPQLLNTWLPPLPKILATNKVVQNLSPTPPSKGPPLPNGLSINWPSIFKKL